MKKICFLAFFSKYMQIWHMNVQETNTPSWEWCYLQYMLQLSLVIAHFKVHTLHSTMVGVSLSDCHKPKWPFYMYDNEYSCILASMVLHTHDVMCVFLHPSLLCVWCKQNLASLPRLSLLFCTASDRKLGGPAWEWGYTKSARIQNWLRRWIRLYASIHGQLSSLANLVI